MPRSILGGRHELGQNFLHHRPTIDKITSVVAGTRGSILEIGAGDGALTRPLTRLGREITAIDVDEHRVARLRRSLPGIVVEHADALKHPLTTSVVVGNIPFHLTTPILRRLLTVGTWQHAVLLTQWEVARKRAGVGGGTMMTAQSAPWFSFQLLDRVPARGFTPQPNVDGGLLVIGRRESPLVPSGERRAYADFIHKVFTGRGGTLPHLVQRASGTQRDIASRMLESSGVGRRSLPRDVRPEQWAAIWRGVRRRQS
jgi:23S rRNA (adenine-N6)-dimethyltransferase